MRKTLNIQNVTSLNKAEKNFHFDLDHFESDRSHVTVMRTSESLRFRKSNSSVAQAYAAMVRSAIRMHKRNHAYHATMKQESFANLYVSFSSRQL